MKSTSESRLSSFPRWILRTDKKVVGIRRNRSGGRTKIDRFQADRATTCTNVHVHLFSGFHSLRIFLYLRSLSLSFHLVLITEVFTRLSKYIDLLEMNIRLEDETRCLKMPRNVESRNDEAKILVV